MKHNKARLSLESLEDRRVLAAWGTPWPGQLTVSFVPDGTQVGSEQSALPQGITQQAWQTEILRAFQMWASYANVDVGVVSDSGQELGTPGAAQGDSRFGDVRIAAVPLGLQSSVAISGPCDPLAGTESADVIFNSSQPFSVGGTLGYDVFSVALHEAGHVFGFADQNTDPTSVNFVLYNGVRTGLSAGDVAQVQALYGPGTSDVYEGIGGNGTFADAALMGVPNVAGKVADASDVDVYQYQIPEYADGPVTVTVRTAGRSLLGADLQVFDADFELVASASSADPLSGEVTVTLPNANPGDTFYIQVRGASGAGVFGVGSYRLQVDSGSVSQSLITALDVTLTNQAALYNDGHDAQTQATARELSTAEFATIPGFDYAINATLVDSTAVNFYRITMPANAPGAVVITAVATQGSTVDPELVVYDEAGAAVPIQILSNDAGAYVVQILEPTANGTYYVALQPNASASPEGQAGTYLLGVDFRATPIVLDTLASSTLTSQSDSSVVGLQTAQAMLYHFVLSFTPPANPAPGAAVGMAMQVIDADGNLVSTLICFENQTVSQNVLLETGTYFVRFFAATQDGSALSGVTYSLKGTLLTNPLDPIVSDPNDPTNPPPQPPPTPPPMPPINVAPTIVNLPPLPPFSNPWIPT